MSDAKDNDSFLRKVVRFVAHPTTDWTDLATPPEEVREVEYAKSELKAMVERKRRNDFVRKREFEMLRKVRREGLSSEQLAALGGSSRLDDSEARLPESGAKPHSGVKAKIDEIEQQMVGDKFSTGSRRPPPFYEAPTQPVPLSQRRSSGNTGAGALARVPPSPAPLPRPTGGPANGEMTRPPPFDVPTIDDVMTLPAPGVTAPPTGLGPTPLSFNAGSDFSNAFALEISEVVHDPELDEAVIAFANADFDLSEQSLVALTGRGGARAQHAETWLVLFDLYRAIGEQQKFEHLAGEYAQQFGWSAPQWFSLPRMVAEAAGDQRAPRSRVGSQVGWACPAEIDVEAVAHLRSQSLQMPLPWVLDWSAVRRIDAQAGARLGELFRYWANEPLELHWLGGERLLEVLADLTPTGVRDVDPVFWQLRLDSLRLANRPDQFDEAAIDYCVTYEVSPPSWERPGCRVRIADSGAHSTTSPPMSVVSDASTSFLESTLPDDAGSVQLTSVDLSGQLVGDIGETLRRMDAELGTAAIVNVSCARLIRVDFIAAGDLLNWVLSRRSENRTVSFSEAHRLVALFFGAMGINEHAKVKVRTV